MAFTGKMVQRITGAQTADIVHTNQYAAAQGRGTFGSAGSGPRARIATNNRTIQSYSHAMTAQSINKYAKALNYQEEMAMKAATAAAQRKEERMATGFGRSGGALDGNRQAANAGADRGGMGRRMFGSGSRFEEASAARSGRFNDEQKFSHIVGASSATRSSSANVKPIIKPNFGLK